MSGTKTWKGVRLVRWLAPMLGLLAMLAPPIAAQAPNALVPAKVPTAERGSAEPLAPMPGGPASLTATDLNSWLDGYIPYGIRSGGIAGAVVVVVKDGQILTARGYGYSDVKTAKGVDPANTLFRPGSISKLFTWTAVMQQVQAGKLDLDRDINDYLDFRIPPKFGKPITLRDLMTHRGGFEETVKYLISEKAADNRPLGEALKRWVPERIYAPGTVPAYSNYGASLAGYIVERVTHEPFADYVQRHIFAPLGMTQSTFAQPLPAALAGKLAKGYDVASGEPQSFELIPLSPAGAMSGTGTDMARFMIAHLANGGSLLNPATAALMHQTADRPIPGLPGMALGFYHEDRNGLNIIGHGGDTNWFHSDLHLYLDKGVGLFISVNSSGKEGAAHILRDRLFTDFTDRYFPRPEAPLPTTATAKAHGEAMAGHYFLSRASDSNWLRLVGLIGQTTVTLNPDNTISVAMLTDPAGVPKRWREVGPWQWQEVNGGGRLNARIENGRVAAFSQAEFAPIFVFMPAPALMNAAWMVPAVLVALGLMLIVAVGWPLRAVIRRCYGYRPDVDRRTLMMDRAVGITAWIALIVAGGWLLIIALLTSSVAYTDGRLDWLMRVLQLLTLVGIAGAAVAVWRASRVARAPDRKVARMIWAVVIAVALVYLVWFALTTRLVTAALSY